MAYLVALFGGALVALGAVGFASPARLLAFVRTFLTQRGLYAVAAIRLVLGVALVAAAPASRAPDALRVLGVIAVVAGMATPFFGVDRFRRVLDWWTARGHGFVRAWSVIVMALGALLVYAVVPGALGPP